MKAVKQLRADNFNHKKSLKACGLVMFNLVCLNFADKLADLLDFAENFGHAVLGYGWLRCYWNTMPCLA